MAFEEVSQCHLARLDATPGFTAAGTEPSAIDTTCTRLVEVQTSRACLGARTQVNAKLQNATSVQHTSTAT